MDGQTLWQMDGWLDRMMDELSKWIDLNSVSLYLFINRLRKIAMRCFNCDDFHHIKNCPEVSDINFDIILTRRWGIFYILKLIVL